MTIAILTFATALIGLIVKFWPNKSESEKVRDAQGKIQQSETKFRETGDNSDLGRLP